MAQAALQTPATDNRVIAFETAATPAQTAMNAALYALTQAAFAQSLAKVDGKEASAEVAKAERAAQWAAFDVINVIEDNAEALAQGDALGLAIAKARDVAEKSIAVYRQRGRDLVTYKVDVAKAGADHVYTKGEKAGQTESGRVKSSPFALVRKLRENAQNNAAKKAADAPFKAKARELVAAAQGMTSDELIDALSSPGDEALALAVMIEDQIVALRGEANILDEFRAMLARLADSDEETLTKAWDMVQAIAPKTPA